MKSCRLILMSLFVFTTCFAEPPKTEDVFLAAVRAAYEAKDMKRIHELTWEKGASTADMQLNDRILTGVVSSIKGIENVTSEPLPSDYAGVNIANGKRYEQTYPAAGLVKIETSGDGGAGSMSTSYAVIEGGYYLITGKSTDLGWKGPQDKPLAVNVNGRGQEKVSVHIKYNASGVDLESDKKPSAEPRKETTPPTVVSGSWFKGFRGQYIEEVTVVSNDDDVDVTLELREDQQYPAGLFYKSAPLKGKGQIHYKKGDTGVSLK